MAKSEIATEFRLGDFWGTARKTKEGSKKKKYKEFLERAKLSNNETQKTKIVDLIANTPDKAELDIAEVKPRIASEAEVVQKEDPEDKDLNPVNKQEIKAAEPEVSFSEWFQVESIDIKVVDDVVIISTENFNNNLNN